ncbi:MAG: hypothetical protein JNJ58_12940 [Chitinophagaceae bacterium]|nr:hypothetical protein [Chitinophagaceae bacterium]
MLKSLVHIILCLVANFLVIHSLRAQDFQFTPNCRNAYQSFMALRINDGKAALNKEIRDNKSNILPLVLINYEDFLSLTFNEDPEEYKKRKPLLDKRLKALEYGNKSSPYYLFSKGLLYVQWSIIRSKYGDYWDAAWDFRRGYILFKDNSKKFPNFPYNQIFLGTQEAIISTIPSGYKWLSNILGLKGNMKSGMGMLKNYLNGTDPNFREEAYLYYIYLKNYLENDIQGALNLIQSNRLDTRNNYLYLFMAANLALNNKNAKVTEELILKRNNDPGYMNFPMLDYELADAKMKRLDYSAIQLFEKYLKDYKGNFYVKDACLSIAYCYYLLGNLKMANVYKDKIKKIGKQDADADKQAHQFALKGKFPDKDLLKARLLNDGGNNNEALNILLAKNLDALQNEDEKLEYYYRLARVYDDLNKDDQALSYYQITIEKGLESTTYFAARSALQSGYIYEKKRNSQEALRCFNQVLEMEDHEFKNSLDQRAKSGINRILGK